MDVRYIIWVTGLKGKYDKVTCNMLEFRRGLEKIGTGVRRWDDSVSVRHGLEYL